MISPTGSFGNMNLFSAPLDGIRRGMERASTSAQNIAQGDVTPENVVGLVQADVLVKANAASVRTADQIIGSLLDAVA